MLGTRTVRRRRRRSLRPQRSLLGGMAAGAALAYLFDPERGHRRRRLAADRTAGAVRHSSRRAAHRLRSGSLLASGRTKGLVHRVLPHRRREPLDDAGLAHKVESVLFRDPHVPKGALSINAERGTVYLRGEVASEELIERIVGSVRRIEGVDDVVSLLHLPGTEAPHAAPHPPAR